MASKPRIVNNLPQFVNSVERKAAGVINAALVRGATELAPLVPIDSSNLLNSQFKDVRKDGSRIVGSVGFTADYALAVHEAKGKLKGLPRPKRNGKDHGRYWGPHDGQPHFLKLAFERAMPEIHAILSKGLKR